MTTVTVPTPVAIYSQRVQIHHDELKNAIAGAMATAPVTGLNRKSIKLEFSVKVSAKCWDFFNVNGTEMLYLSGWVIDEFTMGEDFEIDIGVTGEYQSSYR